MDFSKTLGMTKDKRCTRCSKQIVIGHNPDPTWEFSGKLCNSCHDIVKKGIQEYEVMYRGGYSKLPLELQGWLFVYLFDNRHNIFFKPNNKSKYALKITSVMLTDCKVVTKSELSLKKTLATAGLARWKEQRYLQIDFVDEQKAEHAIFAVKDDKVEFAKNIINLIVAKKKEEK